MSELTTESSKRRHQELVAGSLLARHGIEITEDPRSITDIAIAAVLSGSIDEAFAVSEGLDLPEVEELPAPEGVSTERYGLYMLGQLALTAREYDALRAQGRL